MSEAVPALLAAPAIMKQPLIVGAGLKVDYESGQTGSRW